MEAKETVAKRIFSLARDSVCARHPYLGTAFEKLNNVSEPQVPSCGTDGTGILCDDATASALFLEGKAEAVLAHMLAHCLLGHLWPPRRDLSLACDMVCAFFLADVLPEYCPLLKDARFAALRAKYGAYVYDPEHLEAALSADARFQSERGAMSSFFHMDDHAAWNAAAVPYSVSANAGEGWRMQAKRLRSPRGAGFGMGAGRHETRFHPNRGQRRGLCDVLARWAVPREHAAPDPESFQVPLYLYGLEHFGNTPVLEPTEYREDKKLDSLVIAIDTSGSCQRGLTQRFLEIVRDILEGEGLFFGRFQLLMLQCDAVIQREDLLTSLRDFERYIDTLTIRGGGGTDFRPVFDRVDELVRTHRLCPPRGLLYFSDGRGIFPNDPMNYETVFVFLKHRYDAIDVPGWVHKLVLDAPVPKGGEYYEY